MKDVWKVYFNGSFGGKSLDGSHPGQVLKLNQKFRFAGRDWYVPAAYLTAKGLVLDILMRADKAVLEDFCKKWEHLEDEDVPNDVFEQAERENPLAFEFSPQIELNGQTLPFSQGHGLSYHPLFQNAAACEPALDEHGESDFDTPTERAIIDHYGLNPEDGWAIHRYSFPWKTKRRPKSISSLALTLTPQPVCVPGAEFEVQKPGDIFAFSHNGIPYTLTAQNLEPQTLPKNAFPDAHFDFPNRFTAMTYTVSPAPPKNLISVEDCTQNDPPVEREAPKDYPFMPEAQNAAVIVIGGADGPTALFVTAKSEDKTVLTACSALHFAPPKKIAWRIVFHETPFAPETFPLL